MLLAGDVGGTKTRIGLFSQAPVRPDPVVVRTYRTLDFRDLAALLQRFLDDAGREAADIDVACFGVAGPVTGSRAVLPNVPWIADADVLRHDLAVPRTYLLNDLEALAWSVPVLYDNELETLHDGVANPSGNAALIAPGTGLGMALLVNLDGRLVPKASEGGHADFAARNPDEQVLQRALAQRHGRAELERVISGPGLAAIHRILFPHQCATLTPFPNPDDLPAAISSGALDAGCPSCVRTLEQFVSAFGAAAGNLALTALSTAGCYLGGGITPKILPALRWGMFMNSFREKAPMDDLIARVPVRVIVNSDAGLIGAARFASQGGPGSTRS